MADIVIFAPIVDYITMLSAAAADDLVDYSLSKGYTVEFYSGVEANRLTFDQTADTSALICYYGHGSSGHLHGSFFSILDSRNFDQVQNKIVFTMACLSGRKLSQFALKNKSVYFGSTEEMFPLLNDSRYNYFADFKDMITAIPRALMEGYNCYDALRIYQDKCLAYIDRYRKKIKTEIARENAIRVERNYKFYKLYGDGSMTLEDVLNKVKNAFKSGGFFDRHGYIIPGIVTIGVPLAIKAAEKIKEEVEKKKKEKS